MISRRCLGRIAGSPASLWLVIAALSFAPSPAFSQEKGAEGEKVAAKPVAVVAAAGIDRLLQGVETIAVAAVRSDLFEQLKGFLFNLGDFEGFDRGRPVGVMVFLTAGLPPQPEVVGFLPVKDVDRFVKSLAFGPIHTEPLEGKAGRYEVVGPDGKLQMRIADGWAYLGKTAESVEQTFADPAGLARRFLEPHDMAATFDLTAVPAGLAQLGLGALRLQTEANLKKQKGPEDERRLHRAVADELLDALDDLAKNGERLVVGISVSRETKQARLTARLMRKSDAVGAAAEAKQAAVVWPRFHGAVDATAAARLSLALRLSESQRTIFRDAVQVARRKAVPADAPADGPLPRLFESLAATAEAGRIDLLAQFAGAPPGPFVLVGGVGVAKSDDLAAALPGLLEEARKAPKVAEVKTNAETRSGVVLHRLAGEESSPGIDRLYGERPSFLIGAGKEALWFSVGGRDAAEALGTFIAAGTPATGATPPAAPDAAKAALGAGSAGVEVVLQAGAWVGLQGEDADVRNAELLRNAFARGNDGLRVSYRGDRAAQLQVDFESGWLRLFGLSAGRAIDEKRSP